MTAEKAELLKAGFTCEEGWLRELPPLNTGSLPLAFAYCGMGRYAAVVRSAGPPAAVGERRYQVVPWAGTTAGIARTTARRTGSSSPPESTR